MEISGVARAILQFPVPEGQPAWVGVYIAVGAPVEVELFCKYIWYPVAPDTALNVNAGVVVIPAPVGLTGVGAGGSPPTKKVRPELHGPWPPLFMADTTQD